MKKQPSSSGPSGAPHPGARRNSMLVWWVAIVATAAAVWAVLVLSGATDGATALKGVGGALIIVAGLVDGFVRHRKRTRSRQLASSPEAIRQQVDTDSIRAARERRGEVYAVKELRKQMPQLSLADAVKTVRSL